MSLINDALKRASGTKPAESPPRSAGPMLTPVEDQPRNSGLGPLPVVLCILGIGAILIGGGLWLKSRGTPANANTTGDGQLASVANQSTSVTTPASAARNPIERAAATLQQVQDRNTAVEAEADRMKSAPVAPPQPQSVVQLAQSQVNPAVKAGPSQTPVSEPLASAATPVREPVPAETAPASTTPALKLHAIYFRLRGPTVVINGRTLKTGESIDGAKVISIQRTFVELEQNGSRQTLSMR